MPWAPWSALARHVTSASQSSGPIPIASRRVRIARRIPCGGQAHPAIHFAIHGDVVRGFLEANNVPPAAPPRPCACAPCEHLRQPPSHLPLRRRSNNFKRSSHAASRIRHERLRPTQRRPWAARRGAARPGRPQEGAAALRVQGRWHRRHSAQSAAQAQQVPANRPAPGQ